MGDKIIESNKKLSESVLWDLQEKAYCQYGIEAWNRYGVPSYITSNSNIAKKYAHVVLGYLRDLSANSLIDVHQPVYLLDLGAGTGRLAYFFLKEFLSFLSSSTLSKIQICYVMTDIVPSNLDFWLEHPYLKPYFESGLLDRAIYHHAQSTPVHLLNRNITLTKDTLVNPLILICNYFFDTIPQDLFRFDKGKLEEGRITLTLSENVGTEGQLQPSVINQLHYSYSYEPLVDEEYSPLLETLHKLIDSDRDKIEGCPFLFPSGAMQVLNAFMEISKSRLLLLAGDQGTSSIPQLKESGEPKLSLHGSFSFPVSYNIIASFFRHKLGTSWLTSFADPIFVVMAGCLGMHNPKETQLAFQEHLDTFEPTDYFNLVTMTEKKWQEPPLDHILLLIKLGNWDASVLHVFYSRIRSAIPVANEKQKHLLSSTIDKVYEHFYPIGIKAGDFVLNLGVLLFEMQDYEKAIVYFERAIHISGPSKAVLDNIAACRQKLEHL